MHVKITDQLCFLYRLCTLSNKRKICSLGIKKINIKKLLTFGIPKTPAGFELGSNARHFINSAIKYICMDNKNCNITNMMF